MALIVMAVLSGSGGFGNSIFGGKFDDVSMVVVVVEVMLGSKLG